MLHRSQTAECLLLLTTHTQSQTTIISSCPLPLHRQRALSLSLARPCPQRGRRASVPSLSHSLLMSSHRPPHRSVLPRTSRRRQTTTITSCRLLHAPQSPRLFLMIAPPSPHDSALVPSVLQAIPHRVNALPSSNKRRFTALASPCNNRSVDSISFAAEGGAAILRRYRRCRRRAVHSPCP